ncbi:MAG: hypothetical protein Q9199_004331 [Rusavskia elegans]
MQSKSELEDRVNALERIYQRAGPDKKPALKIRVDNAKAELTAAPTRRELGVTKARQNLQRKQDEATNARTTATTLRQRLQAVQHSSSASGQEIAKLRGDLQNASTSANAKEQEVEAAKSRLVKAEDYLKKGQAATQGKAEPNSGRPSLDAVQTASPTATKQPEQRPDTIPDLDLGEQDLDELFQVFIDKDIMAVQAVQAAKEKEAALQRAAAEEQKARKEATARKAQIDKNREKALAERAQKDRAIAELVAKKREEALAVKIQRLEDTAQHERERVERDRQAEETRRLLQQSEYRGRSQGAPNANPNLANDSDFQVEDEGNNSEPITQRRKRRATRQLSTVEDHADEEDNLDRIPLSLTRKRRRLGVRDDSTSDPNDVREVVAAASGSISSLTDKQKSIAWSTLSNLELMTHCGLTRGFRHKTKAGLVARLVKDNKPLPPDIRLPFMDKCKYNEDEIAKLDYGGLRDELSRLGLSIPNRMDSTASMEAMLIKFIRSNGEGFRHRRAKAASTEAARALSKIQAQERAKQRRHLASSLLSQPVFDPERPTLVVILTRDSSEVDKHTQEERRRTMQNYKIAFEQGRIYNGLHRASFELQHLNQYALSTEIPETPRRVPRFKWLHSVLALPAGSRVVLVLRGIDGLSSNLESWRTFLKGQQSRGHQTTVLFSEGVEQWEGNNILWSHNDWMGPIRETLQDEERYWFGCELQELLESDARVCKELREQLQYLEDSRDGMRQAIAVQGRPPAGRN